MRTHVAALIIAGWSVYVENGPAVKEVKREDDSPEEERAEAKDMDRPIPVRAWNCPLRSCGRMR